MPKVVILTTTAQIIQDGEFKPTAPVWEILNDGNVDLFINNNLRLKPLQSFGVNMMAIAAAFVEKGYDVVHETQFKVHFENQNFLKLITLTQTSIENKA
jgi:hypothetical protein